ncbi:lipolysis-stimulated lipoprotein receptor isoform X7 [Pongo abelii]|uniref:lipolysis-stimulated lipoprotein receptor isoform X7 n=1 Tax=Pongo abelii TaxID=9601 RepID=UPI0023E8EBD0|nr:lipolysis-stimulated lipoprotein receptor isoform X7 [Pongo abelii]XP_054402902.1 lipolysis-stimulated lipoprotein receptor isoform X7 [Pongo abelii]XP_054403076.1 lipolysis-stimulated lipoprotein receptor isoform X7 [Pongo abelii]
MALLAGGLSRGLGSHPAAPGRDAVVFVWLLLSTWCTAPARAIQVTVSNPYHVVILFQPVTLPCTYQMTSTPTQPIVIWKYKSFCRDRIADAFSPASVDNQLNAQLAAGNPGYNPYVECQDSVRTVRVVATKQGNAVTLGDYYQGRRITITGNADLTFDQTAWGDSGVYYCSVVSAQDLQGNNEAYAELIVLGRTSGVAELLPGFQAGPMEDWLFVVVVCLAAFLIFLLLGICWCQCCPHTCCCYVRCPCCPDKCCCPEALYAAGKAATSGVPSIYAPSTYAHLSPAKTPPPPAMIPMGPAYNGYPGGYPGDVDRSSSAGGQGSYVPLLRDTDSSVASEVRSGYRIQASQQDDSMRVLYYMEKELANFDPSRPGPPNGRVERGEQEPWGLRAFKVGGETCLPDTCPRDSWCKPWTGGFLQQSVTPPFPAAMSEVTSLHEDDWRSRPSRGPALTPIRDEEWGGHSPRSPRGWDQEPPREQAGGGWRARRPRARSVDALDDLTPPSTAESGSRSPTSSGGRRGRAYMPPRSRSRDDLYDQDDSRDFPRSRDSHYDDFRSRERPPADPRSHHHRTRDPRDHGSRSGDLLYDGRLLEEAVRKKGSEERRRPHKEEEEEAYYPPAPPPYSETDSQASRERRLKKVRAALPGVQTVPGPPVGPRGSYPFFFLPCRTWP